jgi:hypothetical protein
MSTPAPITVVSVTLAVLRQGEEHPVQISGAFDRITTADAANAAGRAIGEQVAQSLCQRLQHGQDLGSSSATRGSPADRP